MTGQRTALLSTTYFGPVQWYQKLHRYGEVRLECHDHFVKQTYRNRCLIASAQGVQALTVPVIHDGTADIRDVRISDHGNWRHLHWNALCSAYGDSPFFEFYAESADFHLSVFSAYEFDVAVGAVAHDVAGTVEAPEVRV